MAVILAACAKKETPNIPDETEDPDTELPTTKDSVILSQDDIRIIVLDSLSFKYGNTVYRAGDTIFGYKKYVYMVVGNPQTELILSSPHDGNQNGSPEIPDRVTDDTMVRDLNTTALGTEISKAYKAQAGTLPFMVVNTIWRRKVEPNRAANDADHIHPDAIETYKGYHRLLTMARMIVTHHSKKGLVADLHGHGLAVPRIHLGYLVPKSNFYTTGDLSQSGQISSIRSIAAASPLHFDSLARGTRSLGGFLVAKGFRAYPSPVDDVPDGVSDKYTTSGQTYFNGANIIQTHGSRNGGSISAIQLEFYRDGIRDNPANRASAGTKIAGAFYQFMIEHGVIQ